MPDRKRDAVQEPLLENFHVADLLEDGNIEEDGEEEEELVPGTCSVQGGVANLVVTAVGAGMLALPHAFQSVGFLLGLLAFGLVSLLTIYSCATIIRQDF
jgi:hypothetical protein